MFIMQSENYDSIKIQEYLTGQGLKQKIQLAITEFVLSILESKQTDSDNSTKSEL